MLNKINERFWGVSVENRGGNWYAIDGKELRGGIDGVLGEKRGLNAVSRSQHTDNDRLIIDFTTVQRIPKKRLFNVILKVPPV